MFKKVIGITVLLIVSAVASIYFWNQKQQKSVSIATSSPAVKSVTAEYGPPATPAQTYFLSPSELTLLKNKGSEGDVRAIERLTRYYTIYKNDKVEYLAWLKKGAQLNDPTMQYNLAVELIEQNPLSSEARTLLKKAQAGGVTMAAPVLEEMDAYLASTRISPKSKDLGIKNSKN